MSNYTITFGSLGEKLEGKEKRLFTPAFSITLTELEMKSKLKILIGGWHEKMFDNWIHSDTQLRTFLLSENEGYQVTKDN